MEECQTVSTLNGWLKPFARAFERIYPAVATRKGSFDFQGTAVKEEIVWATSLKQKKGSLRICYYTALIIFIVTFFPCRFQKYCTHSRK